MSNHFPDKLNIRLFTLEIHNENEVAISASYGGYLKLEPPILILITIKTLQHPHVIAVPLPHS